MEIALTIFFAVALPVSLYLLIFKPGSAPAPKPAPKDLPAKEENNSPVVSSQEELNAKTAELQKTKGELQKTKEELKQNKQKLFEAREKNKQLEAELKTQKQLERQAIQETETARLHLADLSTALNKLKLELETQKPQARMPAPPSPAAAPPQTETAESSKPANKPAKLIRELSPAEKEKLENVERLISAEHNRAQELEKELKTLKIRFELGQRQLKNFQSSDKLQKDKFRALEKRLNRILLEKDFLLRAMRDLENRCGLQATIAELPKEAFAEEEALQTSEDFSEHGLPAEASAFSENPAESPLENTENA